MYKQNVVRVLVISLALISIVIQLLGCSTPLEWSYVALGDSQAAGTLVGDDNYVAFFAEYLRQDYGAEVQVHNYGILNNSTRKLLYFLRTDPDLRQAVADATVITIWIGGADLQPTTNLYLNEMCGGNDGLDCIREKVDKMNKNLDGILDEIHVLNSSEETRIMIAEIAIPPMVVTNWVNHGSFDVLQKEAFESWLNLIHQAASERGIIVVPTYAAINGQSGDQVNEGLYLDDGQHINIEGHKLIAELHREAWE